MALAARGSDRLSASLMFANRPTKTECGVEILTVIHGHVDITELAIGEACAREDPSDRRRLSEREGIPSGRCRDSALSGAEGLINRNSPLVPFVRSPDHHDEVPTGSDGTRDVAKGHIGIAEEHRAEAADRDVKRSRSKGMCLRIAHLEPDVRHAFAVHQFAGAGDHPFIDIDP